jgi:hypothetical protein
VKTFPAVTAPDGRILAFEVENAHVGPVTVARLLRQAEGVADVEQRRLFSRDSDVHVKFKYLGQPCIVWEPYGDNSRYWIGPETPDVFNGSMSAVETVLASYKPPMHRALIGDLLSLRFGKR